MTTLEQEVWNKWISWLTQAFNVELSSDAFEKFRLYHIRLIEENNKFNLVSVHSSEEILWRHFGDSLACAPLIVAMQSDVVGDFKAADLGSGAGFPGIPLAIVIPKADWTLVESVAKKASFLQKIIEELNLRHVRVLNERAEVLGQNPEHRERYDIVLSRAVTGLSANLEIALPLLKKGGRTFIYKTDTSSSEAELLSATQALSTLGGTIREGIRYKIPNENLNYRILEFEKSSFTPSKYPRKPGIPMKRPM